MAGQGLGFKEYRFHLTCSRSLLHPCSFEQVSPLDENRVHFFQIIVVWPGHLHSGFRIYRKRGSGH